MTAGKNKKLGKKKGQKKKGGDPFSKKEWFEVKTPAGFQGNAGGRICRTVATKTVGTRNVKDNLLGRVFETSLGDIKQHAEDDAFRKFRFRVDEVAGKNCLTSFWGMDLTTDKLRSLVRKWRSLIEAHADVTTTDGYTLRLFCIGFTTNQRGQRRKTSYAQHAQIKVIRKKMVDIMNREASNSDVSELYNKLTTEVIGREIEKVSASVYPLQNVLIRKVKTIRSPKIDVAKILEANAGTSVAPVEDVGKEVAAAAAAPAAVAAK